MPLRQVGAAERGDPRRVLAVVETLREAGRRIPDDIAVAVYDDIPLALDVYPPLTTVGVPQEEPGRSAVRLAPHRTELPDRQLLVLGTHVVVRGSTRRPGS